MQLLSEGKSGARPSPAKDRPLRLAFIVSHPIQYYAPLYQRLAQRADIQIKVFFTWHAGTDAVLDHGFGVPVAWDIPLTEGYEHELAENIASNPGANRFWGLRDPSLVERVLEWQPDVVHITGWAWASHLYAMNEFHRRGMPTLFRGNSHLLDEKPAGLRWLVKRAILTRIYRLPTSFLVTGSANRAYYRAFGVGEERLLPCPHSIDVARFAEPAAAYEDRAGRWREELAIGPHKTTLLFAGKFESRKRPLEFMKLVASLKREDIVAVMVGGGALQSEIDIFAGKHPDLFRILPFQNQSRMPLVYRLGDLCVLMSSHGETWGLAVNEALACGRAVLVSDKVGCAGDVVDDKVGRVFSWDRNDDALETMTQLVADRAVLLAMRGQCTERAWHFDIRETEMGLIKSLARLFPT